MKHFVVLGGPQASGKSSCIKSFNEFVLNLYPCLPKKKDITLFCLQEARQIIVHKYHAMGAIFLTPEQEKEIIETDFQRMKVINEELDESLVYMDECNIFTLAHAKAHQVDLIDQYFNRYLKFLKQINAAVIFLDLSLEISWQRREAIYKSRLRRFPPELREDIYRRYHEYLYNLSMLLDEVWGQLTLPKIKISAKEDHFEIMQKIISFLFEIEVI